MRAIAVLLVVGHHAGGLLPSGYIGVDVFFVLSGFLITTLLLEEIERTGTVGLTSFYARRFLRLYPALVAVCLAAVLGSILIDDRVSAVLAGAAVSLGYIANIWEYSGHDMVLFHHTWTLSLEEQFYLLWPVLLPFVLRSRASAALVALGWCGVEFADLLAGHPPVLHTYIRAAGLPLGCVLAFAWRRPAVRRVLRPFALPSFVGVLTLGACPSSASFLLTGWPLSLAAVLSVPVVGALIGDSPLSRALSRRGLVWLGRRSYGLYLWHYPILSVCINQVPARIPLAIRDAAGVALSLLVAAVSYRYVEHPFLRLKGRFARVADSDSSAALPSDAAPITPGRGAG